MPQQRGGAWLPAIKQVTEGSVAASVAPISLHSARAAAAPARAPAEAQRPDAKRMGMTGVAGADTALLRELVRQQAATNMLLAALLRVASASRRDLRGVARCVWRAHGAMPPHAPPGARSLPALDGPRRMVCAA